MARQASNRKKADSSAKPAIEADFGPEPADTLRHGLHPDLLANPPLNDSDWFRKDDVDCAVALN